MFIIATDDLEYYIPWSRKTCGHTAVDVAKKGSRGQRASAI